MWVAPKLIFSRRASHQHDWAEIQQHWWTCRQDSQAIKAADYELYTASTYSSATDALYVLEVKGVLDRKAQTFIIDAYPVKNTQGHLLPGLSL